MSVLSQIKAILFLVLLLVTSILGSLCVNGTLLPILLVRPQLYRWLFDFGNGLWQWQVAVSPSGYDCCDFCCNNIK